MHQHTAHVKSFFKDKYYCKNFLLNPLYFKATGCLNSLHWVYGPYIQNQRYLRLVKMVEVPGFFWNTRNSESNNFISRRFFNVLKLAETPGA